MAEEYLIEVDRTWPGEPHDGKVAVRDGAIVPPQRLADPRVVSFDGSETVLTPGWINAHAHLELSGATGVTFDGDFVDWIYDVLEFKLSRSESQIREAFRSGCEQLLSSGTCRVFDHCDRTDWILPEAEAVNIDARLLKELIGFLPDQVSDSMAEAATFVEQLENSSVRGGLAPHAPYSAHPELYEAARNLVTEHSGIFSTHLHETSQEMKFVTESSGRFQDLLKDRTGARRESPFEERPLADLSKAGIFDRPGIGVHLNYLDGDDLRWLEAKNCYPTFCPRSYSYFNHGTLPVASWEQRDIPFCLGTDSRASNDGLNMLEELEALHDLLPDLTAETVLESLTVNPSRVMGEPDRGELTLGSPADLSVFRAPSGSLDALAKGDATALAVFIDGGLAYRA